MFLWGFYYFPDTVLLLKIIDNDINKHSVLIKT